MAPVSVFLLGAQWRRWGDDGGDEWCAAWGLAISVLTTTVDEWCAAWGLMHDELHLLLGLLPGGAEDRVDTWCAAWLILGLTTVGRLV